MSRAIWRSQNRDKVRIAENKWRDGNTVYRQKMRAYAKKYRNENHATLAIKERSVKVRFYRSRWRALRRGLVWNLTIDAFTHLITMPCFYCMGNVGETGVALDRKNNQLGYEAENVVPCCGSCNRIKCHLLTHDEMVIAMRVIMKLRRDGETDNSDQADNAGTTGEE